MKTAKNSFINMYKGYIFKSNTSGYVIARNLKTKDTIEGFTILDMPELKQLIDKKSLTTIKN